MVCDLSCKDDCLFADRTQIGQVLLNLIMNSYSAMESKGGTLTVSTQRTENSVVFRVTDTGPGIAPEAWDRLFEPFFTTKEAGKGTGLGLAIAAHIVEAHGGTITADESTDKGASFAVELPIR